MGAEVDTGREETASEMLDHIGCDAVKWADKFSQIAIGLGYSEMDEDWLIGWFANAIEQSARSHPDVKRLLARAEAAEKARDAAIAERDQARGCLILVEEEARRYASHYPQSSDGRNTFLMLADRIAALGGTK